MSTGASFTKAWPVYAIAAGLLLLLIGLFARGSASAAPGAADAGKKSPSAAPAAGCWLTVSSPNPANSSSQLLGITAVSADDLWAVGSSAGISTTPALIEHWDGAAWTIVTSPDLANTTSALNAVNARTATDIWAVGGSLALHWNGTQWSKARIQGNGVELTGVTTISANVAWAVGSAYPQGTAVLHWDGTQWNSVPFPDTASLTGVSGIASNDAWAVGHNTVIHWDGSHWRTVDVPQPPNGWCDSFWGWSLNSISERAANDVWSVGYCYSREAGLAYPLTLHWDGAQWTYYPVHLNRALNVQLNAVDAIDSGDVWAVGSGNDNTPNFINQSVAIHWDGVQWTQVNTPQQGEGSNSLAGVAASGSDIWAAGSYDEAVNGQTSTLVQRYYLSCPQTPTPTATPTLVPPPCPGERFTDVCPGDYFYTATLALADHGILSGYNTVPPCTNSLWIPCFKPYNSSTRGQISKVVSLAAGFNEPVSGKRFEDVPQGSMFYTYTERMAERNIISGYACGGANEPCVPPDNRPYFRTNNNVTRGQLSKMVSLAFGWSDPPTGQDFEDVLPGSTFYTYTAQLYVRNIINGYECGGANEPCVPPDNLPYFRPNNNVTRGQTAKIVQLVRSQPQPTPTPTSAPTSTPAETSTVTVTVTATETPTNPDCQGIPPSQDMQISPGTCEPAGTSFSFAGSGFQQGENVRILVTAPDGTLLGAPYFIQADNNGDAGPIPFNTESGNPTGLWHVTFEGVTSQHGAIGYFMLLPPQGPRK